MHEKFSQGDLLFDRLVDGELSPSERRELLASLDDRRDGWRRCALAFLEAQTWSEGLGHLVRAPATLDSVSLEETKPVVTPASTRGASRSRWQRAGWLAVAAGLLVAFTLGWLGRGGGAPRVATNPLSHDSAAQIADATPSPELPHAERRDDALTLWVRNENGQAQPIQVPLVDAETLDRQLGMQFRTGVPAELRSRLQDRGFDVESKRRYAPLWLENGRSMIVPVEDTRIVPVSQVW